MEEPKGSYIFREFCIWNPGMEDKVTSWYATGRNFSIIIVMSNGIRYLYNFNRPMQLERLPDEPMKDIQDESRAEQQEDFSRALRRTMDDAMENPTSLSFKANIPRTTLYSYLNGTSMPNIYTAMQIADALGCTVYDLTCYEERM